MARAIGTLELFNALKSSFTEDQAHVLSKALRQVEEAQLEELVTKQDLINPETRIDAKLVAFEAKIIKWIVGLAGALFSIDCDPVETPIGP